MSTDQHIFTAPVEKGQVEIGVSQKPWTPEVASCAAFAISGMAGPMVGARKGTFGCAVSTGGYANLARSRPPGLASERSVHSDRGDNPMTHTEPPARTLTAAVLAAECPSPLAAPDAPEKQGWPLSDSETASGGQSGGILALYAKRRALMAAALEYPSRDDDELEELFYQHTDRIEAALLATPATTAAEAYAKCLALIDPELSIPYLAPLLAEIAGHLGEGAL